MKDPKRKQLEPLEIKEWPCPRGYETSTGIWEESGKDAPDCCVGCGCTMNAHVVETQRQINIDVVLDINGE